MTRTRTGNKLLIWCVAIAVIMVIVLIFFGFVRGGGDTIIIEQPKVESVIPDPDPTL